MDESHPNRGAAGPEEPRSQRKVDNLRWLVMLRWTALLAVLFALFIAPVLGIRGLNRPVLFAVVAAGVVYNGAFQLALGRWGSRVDNVLAQALVDASGGRGPWR